MASPSPKVAKVPHQDRMLASKGRWEMLLQKLRLQRVVEVLKSNTVLLQTTEQTLITEGYLEPINTTPKKKGRIKNDQRPWRRM